MDRLIKRILGLAAFLSGLLLAGVSAAEEPLKTPSLDTEGKPLNPPAPTKAGTPKLGGLSGFGGVMLVDMGPSTTACKSNAPCPRPICRSSSRFWAGKVLACGEVGFDEACRTLRAVCL